MGPLTFDQERARRASMLAQLRALDPSLSKVPPSALPEIGVYVPGRGTFAPPVWDDAQTVRQRLVLSVLHTGRHYDDELSDESLVYRFPATKAPGYDRSDIEAGKAALVAGLPIFVIISPKKKIPEREIRVGRIVDVDDVACQFLVTFNSTAPSPLTSLATPSDLEFVVTVESAKKKKRTSLARNNDQAKFAFDVAKRYGPKCAFCSMRVPRLLEAAHVVPVAKNGNDDSRNGLLLCRNHHLSFDLGLVAIASDGQTLLTDAGYSPEVLGVTEERLSTVTGEVPHISAIQWRLELDKRTKGESSNTGAT